MSVGMINGIAALCGVIGIWVVFVITVIGFFRDKKVMKKFSRDYKLAIMKANEARLFYYERVNEMENKKHREGDEWKDG